MALRSPFARWIPATAAFVAMLVAGDAVAQPDVTVILDSERTPQISTNRRNNGAIGPVALGDFSGDAFDDLVMGAPRASGLTTVESGMVYVRFGGNYHQQLPPSQDNRGLYLDLTAPPDLSANFLRSSLFMPDALGRPFAGVQIYPERGGEHFGAAIAIGDFDGDGIDDIAIAAPAPFSVPGSGVVLPGAVYVIFGRPMVDLAPEVFIEQEIAAGRALEIRGRSGVDPDLRDTRFGESLHFANVLSTPGGGPDRMELVIGAPRSAPGGYVYVVRYDDALRGTRSTVTSLPGSSPVTVIRSPENDERFGAAFASGNLVTSTPATELVIGAPRWTPAGTARGRVIVTSVPSGGTHVIGSTMTASIEFRAEDGGGSFGASLAVGDFDTVPGVDLVVGAPTTQVGGVLNAGSVFVIGNPNRFALGPPVGVGFLAVPLLAEVILLQGSEPDGRFGTAVALGDYDFVPGLDLAVGIPGKTSTFYPNQGGVYLYRGKELDAGIYNREAVDKLTLFLVRQPGVRLGQHIAVGRFDQYVGEDFFFSGDGSGPFNSICTSSNQADYEYCHRNREGRRVFGALSGTLPQPDPELSASPQWLSAE